MSALFPKRIGVIRRERAHAIVIAEYSFGLAAPS